MNVVLRSPQALWAWSSDTYVKVFKKNLTWWGLVGTVVPDAAYNLTVLAGTLSTDKSNFLTIAKVLTQYLSHVLNVMDTTQQGQEILGKW